MALLQLYGSADTRARATRWAQDHGFQLLSRRAFCQHALLKRPCPKPVDCWHSWTYEATDHGRVWQRPDGTRFLLAHVYGTPDVVVPIATHFAETRGLRLTVDPTMDWYGATTIPLRYDLA